MGAAEELGAWLRLTLTPGIGGATQRVLLKRFGPPSAIFAAAPAAIADTIGRAAAKVLGREPDAAAIEAALAWADRPGHRILTLADDDYPPALLEIPDPPPLLYVQGDPALLCRPGIAIVGSRNATPGGLKNSERFAASLAGSGWSIVSGLALGIDAAAHRGALDCGGTTVAVIGTGADRIYPARNRELAHLIAAGGAIVSEFRLGTNALAANFPRRNRIIAGLCRGVLVVEAAVPSGSLITARLASDSGREVFAIPGSIHSPLSRGCHALIRQGAKLVETADDILEELGVLAPGNQRRADESPPAAGIEQALLGLLGHDPVSLEELAQRSGKPAEALLAALFELELTGQVGNLPGGRYQRLH